MSNGKITYTNKDYDAILQNLKDNITKVTNKWTDYSDSDLGVSLLHLFAGIGDMLAYYQNFQAGETYLDTTTIRKNAIKIAKMLDYRLFRPVGANVTLTFSTKDGLAATKNIPIPKYTTVSTTSGLNFVTTESEVLKSGSINTTVSAVQGTLQTELFKGTGQAIQEFSLATDNISENFFEVYVNQELWEEDKKLPFSEVREKSYEVIVDYLQRTSIKFNLAGGIVPFENADIEVKYLETQGKDGNTEVATIVEIVSAFTDSNLLVVTNNEKASNGRNHETVTEAKVNAPKALRTLNRAVSSEDYEYLSTGFPGIAKAKAQDGSVAWKTIKVHVAPENGGVASQALKDGLLPYLERRKEICTEVVLADPTYIKVDVSMTIYVKSNFRKSDIQLQAEQIVKEYLSFKNQRFGGGLEPINTFGKRVDIDSSGITIRDIYELIEEIEGVRYAEITMKRQDKTVTETHYVSFLDVEIPELGVITTTMNGGV